MIWHSSDTDSVLNELSVDKDTGLANGVAYERLDIYGKNQITEIKPESFISRFLKTLNSKSVYALVIISVICFAVSYFYGLGDNYSPLLIIGIIILNALVTAFIGHSCDRAVFMQKAAALPTCTVLREGIKRVIPSNELVVGDIIILSEGNYISADARLIESEGLRCNEIAVTGDSIPVEKDGGLLLEDLTPLAARKNMVYSGTSVIHGSGKAVVVETGLNTEIAKMNTGTAGTNASISGIEKKLNSTSRLINISVIVICFFVFLLGVIINFSSQEPFASITAKSLLNSIALGVCAVPESLPFITVIVTALGTGRLLYDGIIIKNTGAIETLSKTTVLCADKTGVFTLDKMTVAGVFDGENINYLRTENIEQKNATRLKLAVACSMLENDTTEAAIEDACFKYAKMTREDVFNIYPRLGVIPFDPQRKMMTSINMLDGKPFAIIKGAPEAVIARCADINKDEMLAACERLAGKALRLICIAIKALDDIPANPNSDEIENDLKFAGIICLADPPRIGAKESINNCLDCSIRVIMITGDNITTARAVAEKIGILTDDSQAVTGLEIEDMTDEELCEAIGSYSVFARISPEQKLRIVKALQAAGEVVTVTGSNFEDADVLSVADVGFAIGADGNDVARGNADAIVNSNDFSAITGVFSRCRNLIRNIKNTVHYLISCNASEILLYIIGLLIFKIPVLSASQLLWINLLTDAAPAISLAIQAEGGSKIHRTENLIKGRFFDKNTVIDILLQAAVLTVCGIAAFAIGNISGRSAAYTMAFLTVSLSQVFHSFNIASTRSVIFTKFKRNEFMVFSTLIAVFISLFLCLTPAGFVFGMRVINIKQALISVALSLAIVPVCEIKKLIDKKLLKS